MDVTGLFDREIMNQPSTEHQVSFHISDLRHICEQSAAERVKLAI